MIHGHRLAVWAAEGSNLKPSVSLDSVNQWLPSPEKDIIISYLSTSKGPVLRGPEKWSQSNEALDLEGTVQGCFSFFRVVLGERKMGVYIFGIFLGGGRD